VALLAILAPACPAQSVSIPPIYSRESITNSATSLPNRLSAYSLITIYGKDLSSISWQASVNELAQRRLPITLPVINLSVRLGSDYLPLIYVSPAQINCLVPATMVPGSFELRVSRSGTAGPAVLVELLPESPELFRSDLIWAAATHSDGRLINPERPARGGDVIILYGTGFGPTGILSNGGEFVRNASELLRRDSFRVRLNQESLPAESILYVGVTPGFAGLYQVNVRLPENLPANPQVEVGWEGNWSALGPRIAATSP
jgi:uncharacterized protein (TIGR03437 family)